jgi:hypothetical protein
MIHYERIFPVAVLACLAAGVAEYAQAQGLAGANNFLAVALGIGLDSRLRRRWWLMVEDGPSEHWQRKRTPI